MLLKVELESESMPNENINNIGLEGFTRKLKKKAPRAACVNGKESSSLMARFMMSLPDPEKDDASGHKRKVLDDVIASALDIHEMMERGATRVKNGAFDKY